MFMILLLLLLRLPFTRLWSQRRFALRIISTAHFFWIIWQSGRYARFADGVIVKAKTKRERLYFDTLTTNSRCFETVVAGTVSSCFLLAAVISMSGSVSLMWSILLNTVNAIVIPLLILLLLFWPRSNANIIVGCLSDCSEQPKLRLFHIGRER